MKSATFMASIKDLAMNLPEFLPEKDLDGEAASFVRKPPAMEQAILYSNMLKRIGKDIEGLTFGVSGFGNVALGTVEKINEMGGKVVTIS